MKFQPGLILRPTQRKPLILSAAASSVRIPVEIDLRSQLLQSNDQGSTSKCVGFGTAGWAEFGNWKYYDDDRQIDPNPIYALAKQTDGMPDVPGTTLEDGLHAAIKLGHFRPADAESVRSVSSLDQVLRALRHGPVLAAFDIDDGWTKAKPDGWIKAGSYPMGGHCVLLCYYYMGRGVQHIGFQNSWNDRQGWRGFNRMTIELFMKKFQYGLVMNWTRELAASSPPTS